MDLDKAADDDLIAASMRMMEKNKAVNVLFRLQKTRNSVEETEKQWVHSRHLAYRVRRLFCQRSETNR